jgi:hypothetical protein
MPFWKVAVHKKVWRGFVLVPILTMRVGFVQRILSTTLSSSSLALSLDQRSGEFSLNGTNTCLGDTLPQYRGVFEEVKAMSQTGMTESIDLLSRRPGDFYIEFRAIDRFLYRISDLYELPLLITAVLLVRSLH